MVVLIPLGARSVVVVPSRTLYFTLKELYSVFLAPLFDLLQRLLRVGDNLLACFGLG
jgi:hypothetical protein